MSDVMLFGVLHMPYEMAMSDECSRRQFYDRAQQAADEIEHERNRANAAEECEATLLDEYKKLRSVLEKMADWDCDCDIGDYGSLLGGKCPSCLANGALPTKNSDQTGL